MSRDLTRVFLCQLGMVRRCSAAAKLLTKAKPHRSPEPHLHRCVPGNDSKDRLFLCPLGTQSGCPGVPSDPKKARVGCATGGLAAGTTTRCRPPHACPYFSLSCNLEHPAERDVCRKPRRPGPEARAGLGQSRRCPGAPEGHRALPSSRGCGAPAETRFPSRAPLLLARARRRGSPGSSSRP